MLCYNTNAQISQINNYNSKTCDIQSDINEQMLISRMTKLRTAQPFNKYWDEI